MEKEKPLGEGICILISRYIKVVVTIAFIAILTSCSLKGENTVVPSVLSSTYSSSSNNIKPSLSPSIHTETTPSPQVVPEQEPDPVISKVTIGAIGDILIHAAVYNDAKQPDGTYSFDKMFDQVKSTTLLPDLLIANQETMIGGKKLGLSTYPNFNSPHEIGDALKEIGVDFVTLANNHTLDRGEKAIQSALSYWDKIQMPYTGSFKSKHDKSKIRVLTKNNITFSILSYTYGTNGMPIPKGKPYLVNLIDMEQIRADVLKAKGLSEVVIVAMHWGQEYHDYPNIDQLKLAQELADIGVDIVIGNHPHVLQPPAWVTGENGNETFVFYSLGNFISSQEGTKKLIGGIGFIDVIKTTTKEGTAIELTNPAFMPTYNYYKDRKNYNILPLDNLPNELLPNAKTRFDETMQHMRTYITDLELINPR